MPFLLLNTETALKVCNGLSKARFVPENPAGQGTRSIWFVPALSHTGMALDIALFSGGVFVLRVIRHTCRAEGYNFLFTVFLNKNCIPFLFRTMRTADSFET